MVRNVAMSIIKIESNSLYTIITSVFLSKSPNRGYYKRIFGCWEGQVRLKPNSQLYYAEGLLSKLWITLMQDKSKSNSISIKIAKEWNLINWSQPKLYQMLLSLQVLWKIEFKSYRNRLALNWLQELLNLHQLWQENLYWMTWDWGKKPQMTWDWGKKPGHYQVQHRTLAWPSWSFCQE